MSGAGLTRNQSTYTVAVSQLAPSPTVLLVEDDRHDRQLFADWLTDAGFWVTQAHNGMQALEQALHAVPDVVVTNLNIPGIDGFELTRRLKLDERTRAVPVIAVTGYAPFTANPGRALRAGCDVVLEKPCSRDDLETAIRKLITGERLQPQK
jgi:CheY-like chemotaxis protein